RDENRAGHDGVIPLEAEGASRHRRMNRAGVAAGESCGRGRPGRSPAPPGPGVVATGVGQSSSTVAAPHGSDGGAFAAVRGPGPADSGYLTVIVRSRLLDRPVLSVQVARTV